MLPHSREDVWEYCWEFQELPVQMPKISDKEALFTFMDGLKAWDKIELQRKGVQTLSQAIATAESLQKSWLLKIQQPI